MGISLASAPPSIMILSPLTNVERMSLPSAWIPLAIFLLRTTGEMIATLRLLATVRGQKMFSWITGFAHSVIFVTALAGVFSQPQDPLSILAFAAGYACGNVLGIILESRLAPGRSLLRILSPGRGNAIVEDLRRKGYGVTELPAQGMRGMVSLILCYVPRRQLNQAQRQVKAVDPEAFISTENVRELRGGWRT